MKKCIALLLSLLLSFGLVGCGAGDLIYLLEDEGDLSYVELLDENELNAADVSDFDADETSFTEASGSDTQTASYEGGDFTLDEDGTYTTYEDVGLYIATYEHLPDNFITKKEARELGWSGGGLDSYAYGMCIGGDYFGNNEGILPKAKGRTYHECDIDTLHANKRGAERIVYSNDGLVYYSDDHYETFTLLYGEE